MHDFQYVPKSEYKPLKAKIMELLYDVQDEIEEHFTFRFDFVGSTKRNMITRDMKSNIGFGAPRCRCFFLLLSWNGLI